MEDKETKKNGRGIDIVKCCASCRYKTLDSHTRVCMKGEGAVLPSYLCPLWEMHPVYEGVGKGNGRVKQSGYLQYVVDKIDESISKDGNDSQIRLRLDEMRKEYIKKHGTIYLSEQ